MASNRGIPSQAHFQRRPASASRYPGSGSNQACYVVLGFTAPVPLWLPVGTQNNHKYSATALAAYTANTFAQNLQYQAGFLYAESATAEHLRGTAIGAVETWALQFLSSFCD